MNQIKNKKIIDILNDFHSIWALNYLANLAGWELETYMPESGARDRGMALAKVKVLMQKLFLDKSFVSKIGELDGESDLNDCERGISRVLKRQLKEFQKLPKDFIEDYEKAINEGQVAWRKAREASDYSAFAPNLKKITDLNIQKADYLGYEDHPYDALLDIYEEGQTTKDVDDYFDSIRGFLEELLAKVKSSSKFSSSHPIAALKYQIADMQYLNNQVLNYFNYDPTRLRIDISTHPFTSSFTSNDVRITTRYNADDFGRSFTSTTHEFGHALYDLQCDPELNYTPIYGGSSLGLHESQSRFWENIIGRSSKFNEIFLDKFHGLGKDFAKYTANDFFEYFNFVQPSLIRVEADELTYHFHIMIRHELEKALISKEIKVSELEEAWNQKYLAYLGVTPPKSSEGVLQDIHWSMGAMGYFSTYSIGTVLSVMWKHFMEEDMGKISNLLDDSDGIQKIQAWLKEKMHKYGSTYTLKDLIKKSLGSELDTKYWKEYMEQKYLSIYS